MANEPNLFFQMEMERELLPGVLREDYFPVFVVRSLQEALATYSDCEVISPRLTGTFLLPYGLLSKVGRILKLAQEGVESFLLDRTALLTEFINKLERPCLELLHFMGSQYKLFPFTSYIFRLNESRQKDFQEQFLEFCYSSEAFSEENNARSHRILEKFLHGLILLFYCNPCSNNELKQSKNWAGDVLGEITVRLVCDDAATKPSPTSHKVMLTMLKEVDIPSTVRIQYYKDQMNVILHLGEPLFSSLEILQYQEQYADTSKVVIQENLASTISLLLDSGLRQDDVIEIIFSNISTAVNWEHLLFMITVWVQEKQKKATTCINDFIKSQIREGLLQRNNDYIITSFILARHCSMIAPESFSRYVNWYSNMFQSETYSPANTPETFTYLVSLLTVWVPIEPSCFLQTHTTDRPFVPSGCRELWNDYVQVAKVRISECKEVEEIMHLEPNLNDPVQYEVEMAIQKFQETKKIPGSIFKMCVLQKKYYHNEFLPALLRKPAGIALTDARLRFIEVLKKDGKIPEEMYNKYKGIKRPS